MVANHHFIANDYLRAFELKNLFSQYAVYYSNLHYQEGEALSSKDRHDLTLKLEETMNEMSLLVLKMKESKPDTGDLKHPIPKLPVPLRKGNECRVAH